MSLENDEPTTANERSLTSNVWKDTVHGYSINSTDVAGKEKPSTKTICPSHKKYLEGYRNKLTGKTYYHAMIQTLPSPWKYNSTLKFSRDTQTAILQDKAQQTPKDASTQVKPRNISLCHMSYKILETTKNYKCYEDITKDYISKVIIVQKYTRRWLAQQELLKRKKDVQLNIFRDEKEKNCETQEDNDWLDSFEKKKLNPTSNDDFSLLFSDLQNWWEFQSSCISKARSGADLKAAMWLLLSYETKKIDDINRKKNMFVEKKNSGGREILLNKAAEAMIWKANGKKIQVQTKNTQRASYLRDLYTTLSIKNIPVQERVDALLNLIECLQPYKCQLTDDLILLANREMDLHLRGIKTNNLEGLQTRIRDLVWQFCRKPVFNPAMQKISKISTYDGSVPYILCCAACKCFYTIPNDSLNESLGKSALENYSIKCNKCLRIENEAWIRKDLELYKRILKLLIQEEKKKPTMSSIIYILQAKDIGFLVENIWKHRSCISGSRRDTDLEFIRFDTQNDWTPWNCLLVTKQEAVNLANFPNLEKKYSKKFKNHIFQNHTEARRYFSRIPRFLPYLTL